MAKISAQQIKDYVKEMVQEINTTNNKNREYYLEKYKPLYTTSSWIFNLILLDEFEGEHKLNLLLQVLSFYEEYQNEKISEDELFEKAQNLFAEDFNKNFVGN